MAIFFLSHSMRLFMLQPLCRFLLFHCGKKEGIIVTYEYNGKSMDKIKNQLDIYFNSYQSANIQIQNVDANKIDLKILNLKGMALYSNRLSQILEKYNISS